MMTKEEFIKSRTKIIHDMLNTPTKSGLCETTRCFAELDNLYDEITGEKEKSWAQIRIENGLWWSKVIVKLNGQNKRGMK